MPIYSLRESDPKGELSAFPQEGPSGIESVNKALGAVLQAINTFKTAKINKGFREAAAKELESGTGEASYEYDPKTGSYSQKVSPKKPDASGVNATMTRFRLAQQFGIDPLTGQKIAPDKLAKPRFGYASDIFSQIFSNPDAMAKVLSGEDEGGPVASDDANIDVLSGPGGSQPKVLDTLELEAQNAIANGADPVKVRARLAQLKAQKTNGSV